MKALDLTGIRFGKLICLSRDINASDGKPQWLCQCDCGRTRITRTSTLRAGQIKSCGCLVVAAAKINSQKRITHGQTGTRLERIWKDMNTRCYNKKARFYKYYGLRGIKICKEWRDSRAKFFEWAINNGYREPLSIDRRNNDKGYSPDNCRWVTQKQQSNNTRRNVFISHNNIRLTISEWSDKCGIPYKSLWYRINAGWKFSDAISKPLRSIKRSSAI